MPNRQYKDMADVFVEWTVESQLQEHDVQSLMHDSNACRDLHKVQFRESLLDEDGRRLICHFRAPDTESVRMALRCVGANIDDLWSGTIHDRPGSATPNVVVECDLNHSILTDTDKTLDAVASEWGDLFGFKMVRAIVSGDGRRMICLYEAPDVESIRFAQSQNDMLVTSIWSCRRILRRGLDWQQN
jgi:hypothetical protein